MGSEDMTALLYNEMGIYNLDEKSWRGREAIEIFLVQRSEDTRRFRFDVRVSGSFGPQWLHLTDGIRHFGCLLPSDAVDAPIFRIEMDLDYAETGPRPLTRIEVNLSAENEWSMARAAEMWRLAEERTPLEAAEHIDERFLEIALMEKRRSPLAATVASLVLLRVRALDRLHDWTRNLANWFAIPDAPVLWVEQLLLSNPGAPPPREGIEFLMALFERGLPALTDVCSFARRQTETYLDSDVPTEDERKELERLRKWLERGGRLGRAGGLLQVYSGEQAEIQPELVSDPDWATGRQAVVAY